MKKIIGRTVVYAVLLLSACNTGNDRKQNGNTTGSTVQQMNEKIIFRVDGQLVTTTGWNISRFDMGHGEQLNITTNMHEDKRTIMINVKGTAAGKYSLKSDGQAYGDYKPDYNNLLNFYSFQDGYFTIRSIDTVHHLLNASFEGTVQNNAGETLTITGGEIINAKLTPGVTRY